MSGKVSSTPAYAGYEVIPMKLLRPLLFGLFIAVMAAVSGCYASTYPANGYYNGGYYGRGYYGYPQGYYGGGGYYARPAGGVYVQPQYNTYQYRGGATYGGGGYSSGGYVAAPAARGAVVVNAR
jgi:hypothetical protein